MHDHRDETGGYDFEQELDETPGDGSDWDESALDETVADVELDESLVELGAHEQARIDEVDPELHIVNVRKKKKRAKKVVETKFTQMIVAGAVGMVGLAIALLAMTWQSRELIITAVVVCPPAWWVTWVRYKKWVASRNAMYRLLQTLGEDVSDMDPRTRRQRKQQRVVMPQDRSRR